MRRPSISGALVIRNGIAQGYPFIEAIEAALPICQEFLVSDGYSTDRTWECLEALALAYPDRVKLYRDEWDLTRGAEVIARMTNRVLDRCAGDYCLNVQANEVLHEEAVEELGTLPELYPKIDLFALPFLNLMGGHVVWLADFRRRLFRRSPMIRSRGDGYDVGLERWAALPGLRQAAGLPDPGGRHYHYLVAPFYRYRALFPEGYLEKIRTRITMLKDEAEAHLWRKEAAYAESVWREMNPSTASPAQFWDSIARFLDDVLWRDLPAGVAPHHPVPRRVLRRTTDAPARMRHLLERWQYPVEETLARLRALRSPSAGEVP